MNTFLFFTQRSISLSKKFNFNIYRSIIFFPGLLLEQSLLPQVDDQLVRNLT